MKSAAPRIILGFVIEIFRLFKFANVNNKKNNANEPPARSKLLIIDLALLFMGTPHFSDRMNQMPMATITAMEIIITTIVRFIPPSGWLSGSVGSVSS